MTNVEKSHWMEETCVKWDQGDELNAYFLGLNKLQEDLGDKGIEWTEKQKILSQ